MRDAETTLLLPDMGGAEPTLLLPDMGGAEEPVLLPDMGYAVDTLLRYPVPIIDDRGWYLGVGYAGVLAAAGVLRSIVRFWQVIFIRIPGSSFRNFPRSCWPPPISKRLVEMAF